MIAHERKRLAHGWTRIDTDKKKCRLAYVRANQTEVGFNAGVRHGRNSAALVPWYWLGHGGYYYPRVIRKNYYRNLS